MIHLQNLIDTVLAKRMLRDNSLESYMVETRPLIATYKKDDACLSVVFLNGFPMPLDIFTICLISAYVPAIRGSNTVSFTEEQKFLLLRMVKSVQMDKHITSMLESSEVEEVALNLVEKLLSIYAALQNGPRAFKDMINEFEENFAMSLASPIEIEI